MSVIEQGYTPSAAAIIADGGIGVLRTDTLYGVVARADNERAVQRVYDAKERTPTKSPIVLIATVSQLFDTYDEATLTRLDKFWPGKNSVILPSTNAPDWLTRGNASVAYRLPEDAKLREFIAATGPLIAPSANPEGLPPAMTIEQAVDYFNESIDVYCDGGTVDETAPSALYRLSDDGAERLR